MLVQGFLFGIVYYSQLYYLPLYFQNTHQFSPLTSAALLLPMFGSQAIASVSAGYYMYRKKHYNEVVWFGFFFWTLGVGLTCMFDVDTPIYAIVLIMLIEGVGIGFIFQPTIVALQAHCDIKDRAVIISNRNFIRALGGAVGLAISATILQNTLQKYIPPKFASLAESAYHTPDLTELGVSPAEMHDILHAYARASKAVFIMNVPFIGLCLLGCLLIEDKGLSRPNEVKPSTGAANLSHEGLAQRRGSTATGSGVSRADPEKPREQV